MPTERTFAPSLPSHRAPTGAGPGDSRPDSVLRTLILALLAALLGLRPRARARHAALAGAATYAPWAELPPEDDEYALPDYAWPEYDGTHMTCVSPLLYVIGPGPNRGMRRLARKIPLARPRLARAPPRAPPSAPPTMNPRQNTPGRGAMARARWSAYFSRVQFSRARTPAPPLPGPVPPAPPPCAAHTAPANWSA